ncbi:MAG: glycosyl hydrolase, partial [Myxococcota bacterium]
GHPLFEEPLSRMIFYQGDFFRTQRNLCIPGIDNVFGRYGFDANKGEYGSEPIACKLVSSTAHQRLKTSPAGLIRDEARRVMCETHAVSPEDYTLKDMYRMADWLEVLGVNMLFIVGYPSSEYGLKYYKLHNLKKHSWWKEINHYSDYVGRLSFMLTRGVHRANIGVLFPTSSYWVRNNRNFLRDSQWQKMEKGFNELSLALLRNQIDFDYLFEPSLLKADIKGNYLVVEEETFSTVIIPPVNLLSLEIKKKLLSFTQKGGRVIAYNPCLINEATTDSLVVAPFMEQIMLLSELIPILESERTIKVEYQGRPNTDIIYHQRSLKNQEIYFILNSGKRNLKNVSITLYVLGHPQIWNPKDGTPGSIDYSIDDIRTNISLSFAPYQSYLIVVDRDKR